MSARFSITLDEKATARLERLAKNDTDRGAVIGRALALEDLYQRELAAGGRLLIERRDGSVAEVVTP